MIAAEGAALALEVRVYDIVLLLITSVDIAMQLYVIVVMFVVTPEKMKPYRFFMMLYTACDLAFAVMIGVALHPVPIGMMPCAGLRGILQFADRHGARFGFSLALFCGTAVLSAQDYCILYRGSVVLRQGRYMSRIVTRKAKLIALLTIFVISSLNAFVGYFLTNVEKVLVFL
ncbi:hypothetical protein AAVH_14041 [Aphelenchoides avenae]|nr:hypothetical protein AAVH_14041 [Aphelenchus avenae]